MAKAIQCECGFVARGDSADDADICYDAVDGPLKDQLRSVEVPAVRGALKREACDPRFILRLHRSHGLATPLTPVDHVIRLINEGLVSCKRLVTTYGPLSRLVASDASGARRRPRSSAALAG